MTVDDKRLFKQHISSICRKAYITINVIVLTLMLSLRHIRESCRDWTSASIGLVLCIPYFCILWGPLSIMSFISGISEIAK